MTRELLLVGILYVFSLDFLFTSEIENSEKQE
jgi:hypothetical protein